MIKNNEHNRLKAYDFEKRVGLYLNQKYKTNFKEKALIVGNNKEHKFDLVSDDNSIVVECKSYKWTKGSNFPSAKISIIIEAIFYFSRIKANKKIIVIQDSFNDKGESLVDVFLKRYDGILDDIEVWAYYVGNSLNDDVVKIKREKKEIWYEKMYKNC
ncbi:MAG: hypothetical protein N2486_00890 [Caloramator sp.]|nr:hypothetical protein [Caloramator sp.]